MRIISWGYDSSVVNAFSNSSQASIFGHAEVLLADMSSRKLRQGEAKASILCEFRYASSIQQLRPIIFIGHNLGGIVIKQVSVLFGVRLRYGGMLNNVSARLSFDRPITTIITKTLILLGFIHDKGSCKQMSSTLP